MSPHVAILFEYPTLSGGEHSMLTVLRELQGSAGIRFTALAPSEGPLAQRLKSLNIAISPFHLRSSAGIRREAQDLSAELSCITGELRPDLLHANSLSMSRLLGRLRHLLPQIHCTGHIRDIMKLSAAAVRDLNRLDGIACVSRATYDFYCSLGLQTDRAQVIYNGVDDTRFRKRSLENARSQLLPGLQPSDRVLLNVGQICLRKGQRDLAQAVTKCLQTSADIHLVLVGRRYSEKAESLAYEQAIADVFASSGRPQHLHRAGYCANVEQWMNAADLLVHSARQEPLGRVLLEAAASELPIVATDVGGTPEILQNQYSGRLVPAGDIDALKRSILHALDNPLQGQSFAAVARNRVKEVFRIKGACTALFEFWQKALHRQQFPGGKD
ncbi:MAG: glycosyltransferase family 4 protein [Fuerstiella sp.]|nr:glycosyltransferase family 4 protein [Fuerstiella sp.]